MKEGYWNVTTELGYTKMFKRHLGLWRWVDEFMALNKIKSVFEVGPGLLDNINKKVETYQSVDLTKNGNSIYDDFTTMNLDEFKGKFDLLLACAVVEHCNGYRDFFKRALDIKAKFVVISFFNGINRYEEHIKTVSDKHTNEFKFYLNSYSQREMEKELDKLGVLNKSEFITLGRKNSILIIRL